MLDSNLQKSITDRIRQVAVPVQILLFGSHARGATSPHSDIDLLVVLDSDEVPKSFKERNANYLKISRSLYEIEKDIPIDLLVYTKAEFERFVASQSLFSKQVISEAVQLI
jgi:uncharacterized protein